MPTRKRPIKPPADPLGDLKVEVHAGLGDSAIKAECPLKHAADVLARLHAELERLGRLRPNVLPFADGVPSTAIYVDDEETGARRLVGFSR